MMDMNDMDAYCGQQQYNTDPSKTVTASGSLCECINSLSSQEKQQHRSKIQVGYDGPFNSNFAG